jgi:predicted amidohydrolase
MLLACVQTDIKFADIDTNLSRTLRWIEQAAQQGAELVVFPECMLSGYAYDNREHATQNALAVDDRPFTVIAQAAGKYDLHVTIGFLEKAGDALFNASALIGAQGMIGHYRKIHLPHLGVDRFVDRGDRPYKILQAGEAKVGLAICYDCSFPEPMRVLALAGADIIALGTNWPSPAERTAEVVPPARSMENHLYFAAANRVGTENGFHFCGRSSICGPDGVILAKSDDDKEALLTAEIDLAVARNKRIERTRDAHVIDRFKDRRPEFYGPVTEQTG